MEVQKLGERLGELQVVAGTLLRITHGQVGKPGEQTDTFEYVSHTDSSSGVDVVVRKVTGEDGQEREPESKLVSRLIRGIKRADSPTPDEAAPVLGPLPHQPEPGTRVVLRAAQGDIPVGALGTVLGIRGDQTQVAFKGGTIAVQWEYHLSPAPPAV